MMAGGPGAADGTASHSRRASAALRASFRGAAYYLLQYAPEGLKGKVADLLLLHKLSSLRAQRGR